MEITLAPVLWFLTLALPLVVGGTLFEEQVRRAVRAVSETVGGLLEGWHLSIATCLSWLRITSWPKNPPPPLGVVIGLLLLVIGGSVAVANYQIMAPTLVILLPFGDAAKFTAIAVVAFTCVLGVLMHLGRGTAPKLGVGVFELALVALIATLAWIRTVAILETEGIVDPLQPVLAAVLAGFLQAAEFIVFWGGVFLAGEALPFIAALPILAGLSAAALVVTVLCAGVNGASRLCEALVDLGIVVRGYVTRLAIAGRGDARSQRKHERALKALSHQDELDAKRAASSAARDDAAWVRARELQARDKAAAHEGAVAARIAGMDEALLEQLTRTLLDRGGELAASVVEEALEQLRTGMKREVERSAPEIANEVARYSFPSRAFDMLRRYVARTTTVH